MKKLAPFFLLPLLTLASLLHAQDTLPKFSVKNLGNKRIVIGWTNTFQSVTQISIQRSFDSLRNFKSILTVADPTTPQNGYVDTKAATDRMFYRLYIQLDKGVYLFSDAKRPVLDTSSITSEITETNPSRIQRPGNNNLALPGISGDSTNGLILTPDNRPKADRWSPSKYIYTSNDGYIRITLPDDSKKYSIKFFTSENEPLFELKDIREKSVKLDKTNFYRAGWFKFELYEEGELKEKNKFLLPKEF